MGCKKQETKKFAALLLSVLLCCAAFAGCGTEEAAVKGVRVGILGNDARQLPFYIARDEGFFEDNGVKLISETVYGTGAELLNEMAAGRIDVGYVDTQSALTFDAMGLVDLEAVAQSTDGGSALVVKSGFEAGNLNELVGQRIAVPGTASLEEFLLMKAMEKAEMAESDVNLVEVKPYDMVSYLSAGSVEAFMGYEPYPWEAETEGVGRVIVTADEIEKDVPASLVVVSSAFAQEQPDMVAGLKSIHNSAIEFICENPKESADKGNLAMGTGSEATRHVVENTSFESTVNEKALKKYIIFLRNADIINVDVDRFIEDFLGN